MSNVNVFLSEKSVIFVWNAVHWRLYVYILYPSGKVSLKTSVHLKLPDIDADMVLVGNVCLITWIAIRKTLTFDIVNYKKIFVGGLLINVSIVKYEINVRENRRGNQEWTIQRHKSTLRTRHSTKTNKTEN
jgi:hypothetical protein